MSMAKEPSIPVHLYRALNKRLETSDKEGAIELYYELLSSGHSVGEILNGIGPVRIKPEHENAATAEHPQSGPDGVVTDTASTASKGSLVGAVQANEQRTCGPRVPYDSESRGAKEPQAAGNTPFDERRSDDWEQLFHKNLPEARSDIVSSAGGHLSPSTGREVVVHSGDRERLRSGRVPSIAKRVTFGALYTAAVASASIAGFSLVRGDRGAEPTITRIQSDISSGTETAAVPGPAADRSEAVAAALIPKKQVAGAHAPHAPRLSEPGAPDLAVSEPLQQVAAGVRKVSSAAGPEADTSQGSGADRLGAVEQSNHAAAAPRESAHEPAPSIAQSSSVPPTEAIETAPYADAGQPDGGAPSGSAGAVSSNPAVLPEPPPTTPTQAAETAYNSEPAKGHATEQAEAATVVPAAQTTVASVPSATAITPVEPRFKNAEADALLARGDAFFATGDLTSARLFYEYAAAAGNGTAALRLGGTFDPAFLARARLGRVQGDLPSALYWYRRARDLGNGDAAILLRGMENTAQ